MNRALYALLAPAFLLGSIGSSARAVERPIHFPPRLKLDRLTPFIDHHQHLFSPADTTIVNDDPQLEGPVPAGIATLLDQRSAYWNDASRLRTVLAPDASVFDNDSHHWLTDGNAAAAYLAKAYNRPLYFRPFAVSVSRDIAHVTGYLADGSGPSAQNKGYFYWTLRAGADGKWLIAVEESFFAVPKRQDPIPAERLIAMLDKAGITGAVVLSEAFWWDGRGQSPSEAYPKVRAENDWTAEQVAKYPNRLVAFCSFNPLNFYAIDELRRCAQSGRFLGLKLSFEGSGVDLSNPDHVAKVRAVFAEANRLRLPIVVHVHGDAPYGRKEAEVMLRQVVAAAPDVTIQIAHLWGGNDYAADALQVYADAVRRREPETKNLYFDVAEVAFVAGNSPQIMQQVAQRIREIGLKRILYGSDAALNGRLEPRDSWELFRKKVPLTDREFAAIANNVAPYLR